MAVPSSFTCDEAAFHSLKTWEYIFKYACLNMVSAGHSIGCRRTFVKCPRLATATGRYGFMKYVVRAPELQNLMFESRKINCCRDGAKYHNRKTSEKTLEGRSLLSQSSRYHPPCALVAPLNVLTWPVLDESALTSSSELVR
ncbi:unannotated protein [freshwater metagenome]|uniref:Unannotated protein n=1 Tax=freshwater metagenome TaxID=449393 RepID=A0A6J7TCV6_9ZZZZ